MTRDEYDAARDVNEDRLRMLADLDSIIRDHEGGPDDDLSLMLQTVRRLAYRRWRDLERKIDEVRVNGCEDDVEWE